MLALKDLRIRGLDGQIESDKRRSQIKGFAALGGIIYIAVDILSGLVD